MLAILSRNSWDNFLDILKAAVGTVKTSFRVRISQQHSLILLVESACFLLFPNLRCLNILNQCFQLLTHTHTHRQTYSYLYICQGDIRILDHFGSIKSQTIFVQHFFGVRSWLSPDPFPGGCGAAFHRGDAEQDGSESTGAAGKLPCSYDLCPLVNKQSYRKQQYIVEFPMEKW